MFIYDIYLLTLFIAQVYCIKL